MLTMLKSGKHGATSMRTRRTLRIEDIVAIVDTREQTPLDLSPIRTETGALPTGDYSIRGLENYVAIERKSLPDLISCIGHERERFERELVRLRSYETKAVVIEASWSDIVAGRWRGKLKPASAIGSVLSWVEFGIPFMFADSHAEAGRMVSKMLWFSASRRFKLLASLGFTDLHGEVDNTQKI